MNSASHASASSAGLTASFQIRVCFLTDRCVTTRVDAREQPEWPPHPGRLFMALAAAYFETDSDDEVKAAERRALEWLASLPAPRMHAVYAAERTPFICYVPVNDASQENKAMLQSAPGMPRSRQPRTFPTVIPQRASDQQATPADVTYEWTTASSLHEHLPALERLCGNMIRIGHSSSLVMAWIDTGPVEQSDMCWDPSSSTADMACRVAVAGELDRLRTACNAERIDLFGDLKIEIEGSAGKAQSAAKKRFAESFGEPYKTSLRPPESTPATLGAWQGYRRQRPDEIPYGAAETNRCFSRDLLILAKYDGPTLNVERTLGLTQALRAALIAAHRGKSIPAWLCGHEDDGSPTSSPHAAFLTLPFAGHPRADGHVMGLALALPEGISVSERGRWLGPLLIDPSTGDATRPVLKLWGRDLPDWTLQLEERLSPPITLQNATWTGPSTTWASVTPVVLDRYPKADRTDDRRGWHMEVVEIVRQACRRGGLPEPQDVDVDSTAWHQGVPRAWSKRRRGWTSDRGAPLGDGFPWMPTKPSRPSKPQVHVWLRFERPIFGPVLIGAGRFAGYGLCQPLSR